MTVRREIAELRRETGTRSSGDWPRCLRQCPSRCSSDGDRHQHEGRQSPTGRGGSEGRAGRPKTRRSNGSVIAAEALINNAG